jgi:nucleoside-diphosphate-sugar epimerase
MRIVVTGHAGFVGSYLVERLVGLGHEVVGIDRQRAEDVPGLVASYEGDLLELKGLVDILKDVECVFHLAAAKSDWGVTRKEYVRENVQVTRRLVEAGKGAGVKRWVFYSTVAVLGSSEKRAGEEAAFAPVTGYGRSKMEAEHVVRELITGDSDARVLIIRPSAIFGPHQPPSTNIYRLIESLSRRRFVMVGRGRSKKTTSYIENVVEATVFAWRRDGIGVVTYHYVDEPVLTTAELVRRICDLLDRPYPRWHLPLSAVLPLARAVDGAVGMLGIDFPITAARVEKFNTSTNFNADAIRYQGFVQPVSVDRALKRTVKWQQSGKTRTARGE